jgi:hypothetical protein
MDACISQAMDRCRDLFCRMPAMDEPEPGGGESLGPDAHPVYSEGNDFPGKLIGNVVRVAFYGDFPERFRVMDSTLFRFTAIDSMDISK